MKCCCCAKAGPNDQALRKVLADTLRGLKARNGGDGVFEHRDELAKAIMRLLGERCSGALPGRCVVLRGVIVTDEVASRVALPSAVVPVQMAWLVSRGVMQPLTEGPQRLPSAIVGFDDGVSLSERDIISAAETSGDPSGVHFESRRTSAVCKGECLLVYSPTGPSASIYRLPSPTEDLLEHETNWGGGLGGVTAPSFACDRRSCVVEPLLLSPVIAEEFAHLSALLAASEMTGASRGLLHSALSYSRTRRQFDTPIASFQSVGHTIAAAFVEIELCLSAIYDVASRSDSEWETREADSYGAYRLCEQRLVPICHDLVRLHGASGLRMGCTAATYLRRVVSLCGRYQSCVTGRFRQSESGVALGEALVV